MLLHQDTLNHTIDFEISSTYMESISLSVGYPVHLAALSSETIYLT